MGSWLKKHQIPLMVFLVWLIHLSGIIGIGIGYEDWFLPKTPMNLLLMFVFVVISFKIKSIHQWITLLVVFMAGFGVELLGVHTGFPFGSYYYGENLGPQFGEVPLMIGVNWVMLVFITGCISNQLNRPTWLRALIGASLMVFIDVFIERVAPNFDFWHWTELHAPIENYFAWFVVSFVLQYWFQHRRIQGNAILSINLFLAQLLFFVVFYLNYGL